MYHSISDNPEPGVSSYYKLNTTPLKFHEQMQWLHRNSYQTIGILEAIKIVNTKKEEINRSVVVTFDDGLKDFIIHAWPVLKKYGQIATIFLPTGFIGDTANKYNKKDCLIWSEVRELRRNGIFFGSHTVNHSLLYRQEWGYIRRQLRESRDTIERQLDCSIKLFSYPYAFPQEDQVFVSRFRKELSDAGYKAGVTTAIGRIGHTSNPFTLKRLPINSSDDPNLFEAKVNGAYDWMAVPQKSLRQVKRLLRCQ